MDSYNYYSKWFNSNEIVNKIENVTPVSVEINIIRDVMDMFEESFRQKEMQLNNMNIQLNNTDQEKWTVRDQFCCQVWNFSHDHDFSEVFQYYPYIVNSIKPHNCPHTNEVKSIRNENNNRADMQNNENIQKLSKEIAILAKKIFTITINRNTQEITIKNLSTKLEQLKLFSERMVELLRYTLIVISILIIFRLSTIENLSDNKKFKDNDLECKNNNLVVHPNKNNTLAFTTAKKLLGQFKPCSLVLTKNSITTSKTIPVNSNTIEHFLKYDKKELKTKFSLKVRSNVSLKFEQNRRLKEKEKKC
ncbi:uncharacterized protein V1478_009017 [Vespula squamosa]|uniref:Uncharacterized protein n=1 Tax=Vespula squamosa TaxID=30214 RepID=A0ABD2AV50_VESSQ